VTFTAKLGRTLLGVVAVLLAIAAVLFSLLMLTGLLTLPYVRTALAVIVASLLKFNWGVFWAVLAALAVRRAFIVCWFLRGRWLGEGGKFHVMTERDHTFLVQDRLQDIADNVWEIRKVHAAVR
jgi:hypothetical protein